MAATVKRVSIVVDTDVGKYSIETERLDAALSFFQRFNSSGNSSRRPAPQTRSSSPQVKTSPKPKADDDEVTRLANFINTELVSRYGMEEVEHFLEQEDINLDEPMTERQVARAWAIIKDTYPDEYSGYAKKRKSKRRKRKSKGEEDDIEF